MKTEDEVVTLVAELIRLEEEIETTKIGVVVCTPGEEWKFEIEGMRLKKEYEDVWQRVKELISVRDKA